MADPNKPIWPYPEIHLVIDGKKHYATLWPHRNGQWCKKHKGKMHYFGVLADPAASLGRWKAEWPAIISGQTKPAVRAATQDAATTVKALCNRWLYAKLTAVEAGELSKATYRKYREFAVLTADVLGDDTLVEHLRPSDFQRLRRVINRFSIYRRSDFIANVRGIFNWGVEAGVIERVPEFGPEFTQPKRRLMRQARKANAIKVMPPGVIRRLLRVADPCEKVIILLGINCGMKSMDIATIDELEVDLRQGIISGHRRKTGSDMLAPLWPETVAAIKAVAHNKPPILRTSDGLPWNGRGTDRVGKAFKELRERLKLRSEFTQGSLRHTLRTVGGRVNRDAVRLIMGQVVGDDLDETYDHDDWLPRVKAVSEHVRDWVFSPAEGRVSARHAAFAARRRAQGAKKSAAPSAST